MIEVTRKNETGFLVKVDEGGSKTKHEVELDNEYYQKLTKGGITKEDLVKKSFEFLLKRESQYSILSKFNLTLIKRYFPEYEEEIAI